MYTVSKSVSDETLNAIITIESAGKVNAKAATSTALGLGQFLNKTWLDCVKRHRPDVMEGKTTAELLAMRTNPSFAIEMLARFTEDNQHIVGMKCTGGDLYLAHFLGAGAAQRCYAADPSTPMSLLVTPDAIKANRSIMEGKTAGQVRTWAAKRMLDSRGHAWVAKYFELPTEEEPENEDTQAEEIPDTQTMPPVVKDTPAATVKVDDPAVLGGVPKERWGAYLLKLVKSKIQWAGTGLGGLSLASIGGFFQDWRVLAVVGVVAVCLTIIIVVERGRKP